MILQILLRSTKKLSTYAIVKSQQERFLRHIDKVQNSVYLCDILHFYCKTKILYIDQ